jgi:hypothetical protein
VVGVATPIAIEGNSNEVEAALVINIDVSKYGIVL